MKDHHHTSMANIPKEVGQPTDFLRRLFDIAVAQAQPANAIGAFLPAQPKGRTLVLGAGKAAGAMATAVDALWPQDAPLSGLVITRYGHIPPHHSRNQGRIEIVEGAHPVPDEAGMLATQRMAQLTRGLTENDLVLCLISGGGSALMSSPAAGITLSDKQQVNKALLRSGAPIDEMNCVRKHLSAIKGGRLAAMCAPARLVTLVISDVPGDYPSVIASGPTVPDPTTCAEALAILTRYGIEVPEAVRTGLATGLLETPKPGDRCFENNEVHVIATPKQSLEAAAAFARSAGLNTYILSDAIEGESREVGKVHAALAQFIARHEQPFQKPCLVLSGGETTVTVLQRGGRGGRATEFLLGCALSLQSEPGVFVLAADTDGIDGVEDNAGAMVTSSTLSRAEGLGLNAAKYLSQNNAYGFFECLGDLIVTGPTYTNVNDFRAILVL